MMKIAFRGYLLTAVLCTTISTAQALTLVDYEANGTQWDATDVPTHASATIADIFGSATPVFGGNNTTNNWPTTTTKNLNDYIGFSLAADSGYELALNQLKIVAYQGGGPTSGEMTYSFDGYTTIAGSQVFGLGANGNSAYANPTTFNFSGATTDQVEFRLYFYNSDVTSGTGQRLFVRDSTNTQSSMNGIFALTGSVDALPVPEPSSFPLICGMAFCFLKRKRDSKIAVSSEIG